MYNIPIIIRLIIVGVTVFIGSLVLGSVNSIYDINMSIPTFIITVFIYHFIDYIIYNIRTHTQKHRFKRIVQKFIKGSIYIIWKFQYILNYKIGGKENI